MLTRMKDGMSNKLSYKDLEIRLSNIQLENEMLRKKMFLLTGCERFGDIDGMDGSCVDCYYDNKELNNKCARFSFGYRICWKKYCEEKENIKEDTVEIDLNF